MNLKKTAEVCDTVELPGFRKGRAPRKLVEKRFGTQIKDDVKQSVVSDCYQKVLEEHKLNPVGNPQFGEIKLEMGQPLNFDVTLEVWPTFELGQYKGLKLKKKPSNITEEDMGKALQGMSLRKAQLTVVQDGSVKKGDHIICDCKVRPEEISFWKMMMLRFSLRTVLLLQNTPVPDLVTKLEGIKSGKECEVEIKLSDNFAKEEFRERCKIETYGKRNKTHGHS